MRWLWLLLAFLCLYGCTPTPRTPGPAYISDKGKVLSKNQVQNLKTVANRLHKMRDVHVAVVSLPSIDSSRLTHEIDEVFGEMPHHGVKESGWLRLKTQVEADREKWRERGILVLASKNPRMIAIRSGRDLTIAFDSKKQYAILEGVAYPRLLRKKDGLAVMATVGQIERDLTRAPQVDPPNAFSSHVINAIVLLSDVATPGWKLYYRFIFDPLLNGLVAALRFTDYSVVGLVTWLFGIYLLTRKNLVQIFVGRMLVFLAKPWLRRPIRGESDIERRDRLIRGLNNLGHLAGIAAKIIGTLIPIPIYACLMLLLFPSWENVLSIRAHLSPWNLDALETHRLFAMHGPFLWWQDPSARCGLWTAVIYAILASPKLILEARWVLEIGTLSDTEASRMGIPTYAYIHAKQIAEADGDVSENYWKGVIIKLVIYPFAIFWLPIAGALFFLLSAAVEVLTIPKSLSDLSKLKRYRA